MACCEKKILRKCFLNWSVKTKGKHYSLALIKRGQ